jgi:MFS-type transporter involved in bile tolerance (Atg22 family)
MFVIIGALLGAVLGSMIAKKRGGKRLDILQYGAVYAMIFAMLGLFVTLILHRMAL